MESFSVPSVGSVACAEGGVGASGYVLLGSAGGTAAPTGSTGWALSGFVAGACAHAETARILTARSTFFVLRKAPVLVTSVGKFLNPHSWQEVALRRFLLAGKSRDFCRPMRRAKFPARGRGFRNQTLLYSGRLI